MARNRKRQREEAKSKAEARNAGIGSFSGLPREASDSLVGRMMKEQERFEKMMD